MDDSLRVSVIVPAYNEAKYIGACLDSLMKQSVKADEIIVVDNNSTDDTVKIAQRYPVKIIHETEQGITPARDRGFNEAKYDIIARADADTILPATWIKRIKKRFSTDEKLIAISGPASFYDLPNLVQNSRWQTKSAWIKLILSFNNIFRQLLRHDCLFGFNCALRKSAWTEIKGSVCHDDKKLHEDLDLAIHLAPLGKIKFIRSLRVSTSVRRWKRPEAYPEYLYRGLASIQTHKTLGMKQRSKQFVKKVMEKASFLDYLPTNFK